MEKSQKASQSEFKQQVYALVRQIPTGRVATYGQIAAWLTTTGVISTRGYRAFGARRVGQAMAHCPDDVPWQRVINAQGKISLQRGAGYEEQRLLLEMEGIEFDAQYRIDLKRFGWSGPEAQTTPSQSPPEE